LRFAWAGFIAIYVALSIADLLLLKLISTPLSQIVSIMLATGSPVAAWTWAELTLLHALLIVGVLGFAFVGGGLLHRSLPRFALTAICTRRYRLILVSLLLGYLGEQLFARTSSAYGSRSSTMPLYVRLLPLSKGDAYTIRLRPPPSETERQRALENIAPLDDPPHVLFLLLESFRGDLVDPVTTPHLHELARESLTFPRGVTEAILTSLSWNVILMDRPGFLYHYDLRRAEFEDLAAWPLEIMHRAGYRIWISSSTDMEANLYTRRLLGTNDTVDRFYMAYEPADTMRNVWDNMATDTLVEWIGEMEIEKPHYLLYQLDSTHWDYYFDEAAVIAEPYSEIVRPSKLRSQDALDLVYARYLNSARQVDNNLGRVLNALKARGIYDNTVVIVVSDHGEGFRVGKVGHSVLQKQTRSIPLIMRLPGVEAIASDAIVSPRDLQPTLHDYLGLETLPDRFTLGSSALPPLKGNNIAITFHGTTKLADLKLDGVLIRFEVRFDENDVTFTPMGVFDHEDQPLQNADDHLINVPWRDALDALMSSVNSP
jgi:hypothetical protein